MLKYYQIHVDQILVDEDLLSFKNQLEEYKSGGRHDVFDNIDIFAENCRSKEKLDKKFELFCRVDDADDSDVIVYGLYLELLQFWGQEEKILEIVSKISKKYQSKCVVFQWNHDVDFARYSKKVENFKNVVVLNFNTSSPNHNDLVLPFWSIQSDVSKSRESKNVFASMCCSLNNSLRYRLASTLSKKEKFLIFSSLPKDQYNDLLKRSLFTMCPRGNGLSSYRFFESIAARSIPVLIADDVALPFEKKVDYENMIVRIPESRVEDFSFILNSLLSIDPAKMLETIDKNLHLFSFGNVQKEVHDFIKFRIGDLSEKQNY